MQPSPSTPAAAPAGVIGVDKPSGWTSHDVVAALRATLRVKRVGHAGTLDPLATGLLPVLVGSATKFSNTLHRAPKVYAARIVFGSETTTDDRGGTPRRAAAPPSLDGADLDDALEPFRGEVAQIPPDFAAIKIEGRRAYDIARGGGQVHAEARIVTVHRLAIASWRSPSLRVLIVCGSGTYVRSLARDIGRALGSAAHLGALRRLAVGALRVEDAEELGRLRAAGAGGILARLRPADERLLELDRRYFDADAEALLSGWEDA
ncbi:MAG: tRNA pseudouridine(55) synthase TruB [Chloroflexi bacterium]|nr:tRNA pseudouridine(55) synthase TruB [Chloroflexota bacterium]